MSPSKQGAIVGVAAPFAFALQLRRSITDATGTNTTQTIST